MDLYKKKKKTNKQKLKHGGPIYLKSGCDQNVTGISNFLIVNPATKL